MDANIVTETKVYDLDKTMARVRKLIALAEHPGTPPAEAQLAREQADSLMLKAAIDEAMVRDSIPAAERQKPGIITVDLGRSDDLFGYVSWLAENIARHCRCMLRTRWDKEQRIYVAKVYGFGPDLRYFELLYTTTRLHMLGVMAARVDHSLSVEDNAYRLHGAGYNWLDMATLYGWKKVRVGYVGLDASERIADMKVPYYHEGTDTYEPATQVGSRFKRAYYRACKARGEQPTQIAANGGESYRASAANGYVSRIASRLQEIAKKQDVSQPGAIVLRSAATDLEDFFREDNEGMYARCPRCGKLSSNRYECEYCGQFIKDRPQPCEACAKAKSGHCRQHPKGSWGRSITWNDGAYATGVAHANTADLGGSRVGSQARPAVGL